MLDKGFEYGSFALDGSVPMTVALKDVSVDFAC